MEGPKNRDWRWALNTGQLNSFILQRPTLDWVVLFLYYVGVCCLGILLFISALVCNPWLFSKPVPGCTSHFSQEKKSHENSEHAWHCVQAASDGAVSGVECWHHPSGFTGAWSQATEQVRRPGNVWSLVWHGGELRDQQHELVSTNSKGLKTRLSV